MNYQASAEFSSSPSFSGVSFFARFPGPTIYPNTKNYLYPMPGEEPERYLLFNPAIPARLCLNATAAAIVRACSEPIGIEELRSQLTAEFGMSAAEFREQVIPFLQSLVAEHFFAMTPPVRERAASQPRPYSWEDMVLGMSGTCSLPCSTCFNAGPVIQFRHNQTASDAQ